jgi:hypothetical protein
VSYYLAGSSQYYLVVTKYQARSQNLKNLIFLVEGGTKEENGAKIVLLAGVGLFILAGGCWNSTTYIHSGHQWFIVLLGLAWRTKADTFNKWPMRNILQQQGGARR